MSLEMDCSSCMRGKHEQHNRSEGLRPGLLGGTYCGCSGDCAERFDRAAERFMGWVRGTENFDPPSGPREHASVPLKPREAATHLLDDCPCPRPCCHSPAPTPPPACQEKR